MKKTTLALALAFGVAGAFAQDLTSKKGEPILPEAGDWAIGMDASPFLKYAGNMLSGGGTNAAPTADFLNANNTIIGKYFVDEKTAYRGILRIGMNSQHAYNNVGSVTGSAPTYPTLPTMVQDKASMSSTFIGLGGGMEMRRGKTRLQGYYGADAMLWLSSSSKKFTYGNALSATNAAGAGDTDWSATAYGPNHGTDVGYASGNRVTSWKSGTTFGIGVRGFIGAEYFIFPKISLAGEFGWGIGLSMTGASTTATESWGGTGSLGTQSVTGNKSGTFWIDTDQSKFGTGTGTLRLNVHF